VLRCNNIWCSAAIWRDISKKTHMIIEISTQWFGAITSALGVAEDGYLLSGALNIYAPKIATIVICGIQAHIWSWRRPRIQSDPRRAFDSTALEAAKGSGAASGPGVARKTRDVEESITSVERHVLMN